MATNKSVTAPSNDSESSGHNDNWLAKNKRQEQVDTYITFAAASGAIAFSIAAAAGFAAGILGFNAFGIVGGIFIGLVGLSGVTLGIATGGIVLAATLLIASLATASFIALYKVSPDNPAQQPEPENAWSKGPADQTPEEIEPENAQSDNSAQPAAVVASVFKKRRRHRETRRMKIESPDSDETSDSPTEYSSDSGSLTSSDSGSESQEAKWSSDPEDTDSEGSNNQQIIVTNATASLRNYNSPPENKPDRSPDPSSYQQTRTTFGGGVSPFNPK